MTDESPSESRAADDSSTQGNPSGAGGGYRAGYVTLYGWTNVGKSTLLNRLVGTKLAAVADVSQTTRRSILGVCDSPGRGQIVLVDTPGLHEPHYRLNRRMVETARSATLGVDLVALVIDSVRGVGPGDRQAAKVVRAGGVPCLAVLNKIDGLRRKALLLPLMRLVVEEWGCAEAFPVSALTGEGCAELVQGLLRRLPERPPAYPQDYLTDQSERALAAEWIREKLLAATRDELPHAIAVSVDRWTEREDGLTEIHATILVDKESQRKIVIGRAGELLRRVGTAARLELERLLERRVYLELWVKVARDWRDDEATLHGLGLD